MFPINEPVPSLMMGVGTAKITYSVCTQTNKTAHMPNDQLHSADAFSDVSVAQFCFPLVACPEEVIERLKAVWSASICSVRVLLSSS